MTNSIQSFTTISKQEKAFLLRFSVNYEANISKLLENLGEMFPSYYKDSDIIIKFKSSTTHWCVTFQERVTQLTTDLNYNCDQAKKNMYSTLTKTLSLLINFHEQTSQRFASCVESEEIYFLGSKFKVCILRCETAYMICLTGYN